MLKGRSLTSVYLSFSIFLLRSNATFVRSELAVSSASCCLGGCLGDFQHLRVL